MSKVFNVLARRPPSGLHLRHLSNRISLFLALPHDSHDSMSLAGKLREIGGTEGAPSKAQNDAD